MRLSYPTEKGDTFPRLEKGIVPINIVVSGVSLGFPALGDVIDRETHIHFSKHKCHQKNSLVNVALYHIHHIWHYRVRLRESGQPIGRLRKTCKNAFPRTIPVSFGRLDTPIATESSLNSGPESMVQTLQDIVTIIYCIGMYGRGEAQAQKIETNGMERQRMERRMEWKDKVFIESVVDKCKVFNNCSKNFVHQ
ncbi:hypothetical protein TNCV_2756851 [Trichonephila clavipes]|nr:hypothetical protein TNCV_2756851 [Trichonephila clavipes]